MSAPLVDRLIDQLAARGMKVVPGSSPGQLCLTGNTKEADAAVMNALRLFKSQLLERYGAAPRPEPEPPAPQPPPDEEPRAAGVVACGLCGRELDATDRAVVATNPLLCDRGGASAQRNKLTGEVVREAIPRCPFKGGNP